MSTSWRFTPTEMFVLWDFLQVSRFPYPLDVRASGATTNDWARLRAQAHQQLTATGALVGQRLDADLEPVLRTLVRPRVAVDAYGFYGDREESVVRIAGGHAGGPAVLAVQLPGASERSGGDVVVSVLPVAELADAVATALPPVPPGREPALRLAASDLQPDESVTQPVTPTPSQRGRAQLARLTRAPLAGAGQFGVTTIDGDAAARAGALRWFDRPGDGRYLMTVDGSVTVRGADSAVIAVALREQLQRPALRR